MAIDIRAGVSCSLGTIISGSIGDDYLQGSGLIKTQGSVLISGLITPAMGTVVTFNYAKQGIARDIPRKLRVLSSFADPFRRTTQVELGCKLTYSSDLKEAIKWNAFNDPENSEYTDEDAAIVTLPIYASSVANQCLAKIGIISNQMPLTNSFSIAEFDFSSGYVDILSSLLVSESYFGYLDKNEVLQIESLDKESGEGPVFTDSDIIDLGPIGVGQLPGESVTVSYSTLKLKAPTEEEAEAAGGGSGSPSGSPSGGIGGPLDPELTEEEAAAEEDRREEQQRKLNWEVVETTNSPQDYYISYTRTVEGVSTDYVAHYTGTTSNRVETKYITIRTKKEEPEETDTDEAITSTLNFIGSAVFPSFFTIGSTASLTPEQQIEFDSSPTSVLDEVWPDADKDDRVVDGFDEWVYTGSGWELNPPTNNERFDADPESVLSEYFPLARPYDYVSDGPIKWIYSGSSWAKPEPPPEEPVVWASDGKTETKEVPSLKTSTETGPLISIASSIAQDYLSEGYSFSSTGVIISRTTETFTYDDFGNQIGSKREKYASQLGILAGVSLNWAEGNSFISYDSYFATAIIPSETVITSSETSGDYTKDVTSTYIKYAFTQNGQQQIAKATEKSPTIPGSINIINYVIDSGLVHNNTEVTVSRKGFTTSQERPPVAERTNTQYAKGTPTEEEEEASPEDSASSASGGDGESDPNNGWSTESVSEIALALGSASAERRIEFSLPYAADDRFVGPAGGPFYSFSSGVEEKAMQYGRVQNRLLLGNRSGVSIQVAPERLPSVPFGSIYIEANGLTALYRVNGASWAFDSNGIVASTDALFWAAVGGTGDFWFPTAPGIVSLPSSPAVVNTAPTQVIGSVETVGAAPQVVLDTTFPDAVTGDGVQDEVTGNFWTYSGTTWNNVGTTPGPVTTATTVFLPYNETAIYSARIRLLNIVRKFSYSLELLTEIPDLVIVPVLSIISAPAFIIVPLVSITVTLPSIIVSGGASIAVPISFIEITIFTPLVSAGASVLTPSASIEITVNAMPYVGSEATVIQVSAVNLQLDAGPVTISSGKAVEIPSVPFTLLGRVPLINPIIDANFSSVSLLLHMGGTSGTTTFTDSSSNALLVNKSPNSPLISNLQSKFGGTSAEFSSVLLNYLNVNNPLVNLGSQTGSWTVEQWVRINSTGNRGLWHNGVLTGGTNNWSCYAQFSGSNYRVIVTAVNANFNTEFNAFTNSYPCALNTWHHIATSYNGTTLRTFVDGTLHASAISANWGLALAPGDNFWIGARRDSSSPIYMQGHLDEVRITKGVARYTSNFTAPTAPFPDM